MKFVSAYWNDNIYIIFIGINPQFVKQTIFYIYQIHFLPKHVCIHYFRYPKK